MTQSLLLAQVQHLPLLFRGHLVLGLITSVHATDGSLHLHPHLSATDQFAQLDQDQYHAPQHLQMFYTA